MVASRKELEEARKNNMPSTEFKTWEGFGPCFTF
jgi:hypothetical protein